MKVKQKGFTLIELMVVIVIIGILIAVALPNFVGAQDRAKEASLKGNMRTFQTLLETYAVDWGGVYPNNMPAFEAEGIARDYWKEIVNPYTQVAGDEGAYRINIGGIIPLGQALPNRGKVIYHTPIDDNTRYFIYGREKRGYLLLHKGKPLLLTNG